ncbi:MAG: alanine--tRNA ligase-related protein, partial [Alphaproteobacteria bacterium]
MSLKTEYKIIADHLRSSCFLIADGILPSNEGRGYVLRRIIRRSVRQIHKLGAKNLIMHQLVEALIAEMGENFPELNRAKNLIIETLKNEEEKFRETLENGLKILDDEIFKIKNSN